MDRENGMWRRLGMGAGGLGGGSGVMKGTEQLVCMGICFQQKKMLTNTHSSHKQAHNMSSKKTVINLRKYND
jgi:hypothetical protein